MLLCPWALYPFSLSLALCWSVTNNHSMQLRRSRAHVFPNYLCARVCGGVCVYVAIVLWWLPGLALFSSRKASLTFFFALRLLTNINPHNVFCSESQSLGPYLHWIKQVPRIFGPELIRINSLIKTAQSAVSKNRAERGFCFAASFW